MTFVLAESKGSKSAVANLTDLLADGKRVGWPDTTKHNTKQHTGVEPLRLVPYSPLASHENVRVE